MTDNVTVERITAADTHDLRRRVLRDGTPTQQVVFDGDDEPATVHFGARRHGRLVSVATLRYRQDPDRHDAPADAYQLRGMATEPAEGGAGIGSTLVAAAIAFATEAGAREIWAHARVPALAFYRRLGFEVVSDEYLESVTGLPHRNIVLRLD